MWSPSRAAAPSPPWSSQASVSPTGQPGPQSGTTFPSVRLDSSNGIGQPWARDLELMHHYSTATGSTMAQGEGARHVWRSIFPQEGYTHEYVMHGVLSLAALHKAFLIPGHRDTYLTLSAYHHTIGQETFRSLLPHVTNANWRPVFCFATIVVAYVLCLPTHAGHVSAATTPISKTLELLSVTKGIRAILLPYIPQLNSTSFAPLVDSVWIVSPEFSQDQYVLRRHKHTSEY